MRPFVARPRTDRGHLRRLPPERRASRTRWGRTTSSPPTRAASSASSRATGSSTSSAAAAARARSTSRRSRAPSTAPARATVPSPRAAPALQRPRAVRDRRRHGLRDDRRADERHRLGPLPQADRGGRLHGRRRGRARAGARRREPARREHGRRPARVGAGDDDVPERDRDRAGGRADPDHGRQLAVLGARGRAEVRPGQGRRQLDQPQGGRGGVPRAGAAWSAATAPAWS